MSHYVPVLLWMSLNNVTKYINYSKACVKLTLKKRPKIGFQAELSLNAGQKYCLFLSGRFTQVLLY